jgi:hypothetical protein
LSKRTYSGTLGGVPNQPGTQHRSVRVSDEDWSDAEAAARSMGTDRAKIINAFLRWYLRRPGAELPERPGDQPPAGDQDI